MPMISPSRSARAPPELPGEMGASVWSRSTSELSCRPPVSSAGNSRPMALKTPEVTVDWKPEGLPMATASWPTASLRPSPKLAGAQTSGQLLEGNDARYVEVVVPINWAGPQALIVPWQTEGAEPTPVLNRTGIPELEAVP